jgi:DNA-binding transcriptional regulator LsrR (DeoR family)
MGGARDEPDDLLQVAWLYHVGQMSQEEVSRRLGMSRFKVLRLLAEARERGLVRVSVEHGTSATLDLASRLSDLFGMREVQAAPLPPEADDEQARRAVGMMAAGLLRRIGASGPLTIGLGWGRTVAAMTEALTGLRNPELRFVSLMGTMTRVSGTGPFDVTTRLAALTGGTALVLPAPFLCDSEADMQVVLRQRLVRDTLDVARKANHSILSLGECTADALLFRSGMLTDQDVEELRRSGAVADTTGKFFNEDGRPAETSLNRRAPSIGINDLRAMDTTLLVAGANKARAARAVLRSGLANRLICDELAARALLAMGV